MTEKTRKVSLRQRVFSYLNLAPGAKYSAVIKKFQKVPQGVKVPSKFAIHKYFYEYRKLPPDKKTIKTNQTRKKGKKRAIQTIKQSFVNAEEAAEDFKEFVGWVDDKGGVHEGSAFPPPINRDNIYCGILEYELQAFKTLYMNKNAMLKWAREHGKTYIAAWFIEWSMSRMGEKWLYFSSTGIYIKVGNWIYRWAKRAGTILKVTKHERQNTYNRFELLNGAELQIHEYSSEKVVGEHGWNIAMDDIVKKNWQAKPSEEKKAENQWLYNLNYIGRKRLFVFGTRKFEGDLLEFLEDRVKNLAVDIRTPYEMEGEFPNWKPKLDKKTQKEILIAPELHTHEELDEKKDDDYDAFMAEEMQDPRPREGGEWTEDDIHTVLTWGDIRLYDMAAISVDPAWTIEQHSDFTGITVILKYRLGRKFLVIRSVIKKMKTNSWTDRKGVKHIGVLEAVEEMFQWVKGTFPYLNAIIVPFEMNSGGTVMVQQANTYSDIYEFATHIVEVKHGPTDPKKDRISAELGAPIRKGNVIFLQEIADRCDTKTDLMYQILMFPNLKNDDGVDSLGMGKDELNKHVRKDAPEGIRELIRIRREAQQILYEEDWDKKMRMPWMAKRVSKNAQLRHQGMAHLIKKKEKLKKIKPPWEK